MRYQFTECEVDLGRRELRRQGELVPLQPRVFDLLVYLLSHRDRAISKDELQDEVWAGSIVSETALTRALMKARKAVGDDADQQRVLKTVHGHGYRFVAELTETEPAPTAAPSDTAAAPAPADEASPPASRNWIGVLGATAMLALAALAFVLLSRPSDGGDLRVGVLPVMNLTGSGEFDWAPLGLMSLVNKVISESGGPAVVSSGEMAGLNLTFADPATPEPGLLDKLRGELKTTHLLAAALRRRGSELVLDYVVHRADGQSPVRRLLGGNPAQLAQTMTREVLATLPNAGARREVRVVSGNQFAAEAYAKGLALQLEGRVEEARNLFEVSVAEDPEAFWPRYELGLTMRRLATTEADYEKALSFAESMLGLAEEEPGGKALVAVHNAIAQIHARLGDRKAAEENYTQALAVATERGERAQLPTVLVNLSILARGDERYEDARGHLYRAQEINEQLGRDPGGHIPHSLGQIDLAEGNYEAAANHYRTALRLFRENNRRREQASSLSALARVLLRLGRFSEADAMLTDSLTLRRELDHLIGVVDTLLTRAELEIARGDFDRAAGAAREAQEGAASLGSQRRQEVALGALYRARLLDRDFAEAAAVWETWRELDPELEESWNGQLVQGEAARIEGRLTDALTLAEKLIDQAVTLDRADREVQALALKARASHDAGDPETPQAYRAALAVARGQNNNLRLGTLLLRTADWHLDQGDPEAAAPVLAELAVLHPDWPRVATLRARLAYARGEVDAAREAMAAARSAAGSAWDQESESWYQEVVGDSAGN
ncbi:MAG: tetratricopeptide repeat protein [Pseudomonadota bacterium]